MCRTGPFAAGSESPIAYPLAVLMARPMGRRAARGPSAGRGAVNWERGEIVWRGIVVSKNGRIGACRGRQMALSFVSLKGGFTQTAWLRRFEPKKREPAGL
ncbi:hypothetical protein LMG27198_29950 [Methylocystis echinoides]|uniref:Uncharacterized protein n=1 Tax=Methylocystis echinoides TaxID=29468 RepID=A0A9W6GVR4_9HYPH|nr:hypothetical protein LMG27198_29950 [Methylocystis echinoides]